MDLSKYNFNCQKAFHQGLQLAKSYGHQTLEVEHVAFALVREHKFLAADMPFDQVLSALQTHLRRQSKVFGADRVGFGLRLDAALDEAEGKSGTSLVDEASLWQALIRQSTTLKMVLKKFESVTSKEETPPQNATSSFEFSQFESLHKKKNQPSPKESTPPEAKPKKVEEVLEKFTVDLTAKAERGELDPVIGRDLEVRRALEILGRKKKNNPILIGEPGVGKSAIAEALALRIVSSQVPETMRNKRVLSLDLGSLLAGAKYRGEFEDRVKHLIKAVENHKGQIVLFIDEIHMIVGAGNQEGGADVANLLKPALARGEIHCIGATTLDEYRKYVEKDSALERRFQPIQIEEPSRNAAITILRGLKSQYEVHHGVKVEDEALIASVDLSIRYLPARTLPDKAIDLLDEACSRLKLEIASMPAELDRLRGLIESLEIERKSIPPSSKNASAIGIIDGKLISTRSEFDQMNLIWRQHQGLLEQLATLKSKQQDSHKLFEQSKTNGEYDFAAKLQYGEIPKLSQDIQAVQTKLDDIQKRYHFLRQLVSRREVADVVSSWTGIPLQKLLDSEAERLMGIEQRLGERVFGQEEALKSVSRAIRRSRAGTGDPGRPLGVFMFLGPTGVGKTETAKAIAQELFDDESKLIRIDMSEYLQEHTVARLIGAPPGYVGYGQGGELSEAVRRKPYAVVLFDEIEKAHPRVLDILLQIFDDGRLTDGTGKLVDFTNTLIVLTSNIKIQTGFAMDESAFEFNVRTSLTEHLRPELVNRIDQVVLFKSLGSMQFTRLIDKELKLLNERVKERSLRLYLSKKMRDHLLGTIQNGSFGGRALKRAFQSLIIDSVSERIITESSSFTGAWTLDMDEYSRIVFIRGTDEVALLPPAKDVS